MHPKIVARMRRGKAPFRFPAAPFAKPMNQLHPSITRQRRRRLYARALQFSIGGAVAFSALGQDASRMDKLEAENAALKARLDSLESIAKKEGIVPSGAE